jgi:hypothetical protein
MNPSPREKQALIARQEIRTVMIPDTAKRNPAIKPEYRTPQAILLYHLHLHLRLRFHFHLHLIANKSRMLSMLSRIY